MPRIIYEDLEEWLDELSDSVAEVHRNQIRLTKREDEAENSKGMVFDIDLHASFAIPCGEFEVIECLVSCGQDIRGDCADEEGSQKYDELANQIMMKCSSLNLKVRGGTWID